MYSKVHSYTILLVLVVCWLILSPVYSHDQISKIVSDEQDLPVEEDISVTTSVSHKYISNNLPSDIAVLFDISTNNVISKSDVKKNDKKVRDPYELAIVLDRSGSMAFDPIEQAKNAMISIVDNMIEGDIIHIIQYDDSVQTVIRNGNKASQTEIINAIKRIYPGGSTNLFGGLQRAYEILTESIAERKTDKSDKNQISHSRIFLFSDGLLNAGITNQRKILNTIAEWKNNLDITISTFGIGYGFDRNLMTSIAEYGRGDFFFIDSPQAISKVVEIARKDAANIFGTDAILTLKTANNSNIDIKLNDLFDRGILDTNNPNFNQIKINDLRIGDSKYVLIELKVEPKDLGMNEKGKVNILEWKLSYNTKVNHIKQQQSVFGTVDIQITNEHDDVLKNDEININDDVLVLWDVNKMISLDKQILDDITIGNFERAKTTRAQRQQKLNAMNDKNSRYNSYISKKGTSKMGQTILNSHRRMSDILIEDQMERLDELNGQEREELRYAYHSAYNRNQDSCVDHMDL